MALTIAVFMALVSIGASAADTTARLKTSIENDTMFRIVPADTLIEAWNRNKSGFRENYGGMNVAVTGVVRENTLESGRRKAKLYSERGSGFFTVDLSAQITLDTGALRAGDRITVYGEIVASVLSGTGIFGGGDYIIEAKAAKLNPKAELMNGDYCFYDGEPMNGRMVNDIAEDRHVFFKVPESWLNEGIYSRLSNNGIHGYQFSLNAIAPVDEVNPEIFYIFWFDYQQYLDQPPEAPTNGDNKDIEEAIIRNILENLEDSFKINVSDVKAANGMKLNYCATTYCPEDGRDYRLEFFFKPDSKGITCMLYLYYPGRNTVSHLREATYLIESIGG